MHSGKTISLPLLRATPAAALGKTAAPFKKYFSMTMFSLKNYSWSSARWRFDVTKDLNPARELNSLNTEGEAGRRVLIVFLL